MFENVLVGIDGNWGGRDAIALASRLAAKGAQLTLVNVREGGLHPLHAATPGALDAERARSTELLKREGADGGADGAELVSVVAASPGRGLHQEAEERGADLIVVGSCRYGAFGRAMLGDDSRGALNGAPCAVAIAARGYSEHPLPLAKIGVGYDGSPESVAALAAAQDIAKPTRASVHALEVVSIPSYAFTGIVPPAMGDTVDVMVKQAEERIAALPGVEGRAVYGLAGEELASFGGEMDLLVVGSRNYGPVRRLVLGSTSDYLERHARCSLVVLPRTHEDDA